MAAVTKNVEASIANLEAKLKSGQNIDELSLVEFFWSTCGHLVKNLPKSPRANTTILSKIIGCICGDLLRMPHDNWLRTEALQCGDRNEQLRFLNYCFMIFQSTVDDAAEVQPRSTKSQSKSNDKNAGHKRRAVLYSPRIAMIKNRHMLQIRRQSIQQTIIDRWMQTPLDEVALKSPLGLSRDIERLRTKVRIELTTQTRQKTQSPPTIDIGKRTPPPARHLSPSFERHLICMERRRAQCALRNALHTVRVGDIRRQRDVSETMRTELSKRRNYNEKAKLVARERARAWFAAARKAQNELLLERHEEKHNDGNTISRDLTT